MATLSGALCQTLKGLIDEEAKTYGEYNKLADKILEQDPNAIIAAMTIRDVARQQNFHSHIFGGIYLNNCTPGA